MRGPCLEMTARSICKFEPFLVSIFFPGVVNPQKFLFRGSGLGPEILHLSKMRPKLPVCGSYFEYYCLDYILSKGISMTNITQLPEIISSTPRNVDDAIFPSLRSQSQVAWQLSTWTLKSR